MDTIRYRGEVCRVRHGRYAANHAPSLSLTVAATGEPMATVTVNLEDAALREARLGPGEVVVNQDVVTLGGLPDLIAGGLLADTGRRAKQGFVEFVIARVRPG